MSSQGRILVTRTRHLRMVKRKLLQRTLNTTFRCAGRHPSETSPEIRRSSVFIIVSWLFVFRTLVAPVSFWRARENVINYCAGLVSCALLVVYCGWCLTYLWSSYIIRVWRWRRAGVLILFRSTFQSVAFTAVYSDKQLFSQPVAYAENFHWAVSKCQNFSLH